MTHQREGQNRQVPRIRVNFDVIYEVDRPLEVKMLVGGKEVRASMLDLGEGGMAILTDFDIPRSAVLSIKFTLVLGNEASRPMFITGEVCYDVLLSPRQRRLGIRFIHIKDQDREAIAQFVDSVLG